jgi:hypothetical protein
VRGRKPVPAEVLGEARRLARKNPETGQKRSLRQIVKELAALGYVAGCPSSGLDRRHHVIVALTKLVQTLPFRVPSFN